jgi:hypothetical protein
MTAQMKGVLVALGFVFIFKPIMAELASILFLHLVSAKSGLENDVSDKLVSRYGAGVKYEDSP